MPAPSFFLLSLTIYAILIYRYDYHDQRRLIMHIACPPAVTALLRRLHETGYEAYLVGGQPP